MNMNRSDNNQGARSLWRWSMFSVVVTLSLLGHDAVMTADAHGMADRVHSSHQSEPATVFDGPAESSVTSSGLQAYTPLDACGTYRVAATLAQPKVNVSLWNYTMTSWLTSFTVIKNTLVPANGDGFATSPRDRRALFQVFLI